MILELKNVTKLYSNGRGVEDISFTLTAGEILGLLGPNGSGKTTTMKAIMGLVKPSSGEITICDEDAINDHELAMAHTGALIEAPALYEYLTPEQNLKLAAKFYKEVDDAYIEEVLKMVQMDRYKKDKTSSLSLGMKQRVGIALALISKPKLLILDEPANGLDIDGMQFVRELVKQMAENGTAVMMSSHLAHEIQQTATKVAVIKEGKLLALESMEKIIENHENVEEFFLSVRGLAI